MRRIVRNQSSYVSIARNNDTPRINVRNSTVGLQEVTNVPAMCKRTQGVLMLGTLLSPLSQLARLLAKPTLLLARPTLLLYAPLLSQVVISKEGISVSDRKYTIDLLTEISMLGLLLL
ncbi:hypothetical protein E6C27_scaffold2741G00080 [Cucumis melo var. makuwa]|uniref:Uncharacterized protein n=1 Tax=Cucumis melo var. makuwa TaxID=1194695 RepID=A0A5A7TRP1_CUCMM|nr:hypothetical protein E6C27_scaffold2741G00080 [Cucumis melo var. makuwa]